MLLKACTILIAIAVSVWADQECDNRAIAECRPENYPTDYPETSEELMRDCTIFHEAGSCFATFFFENKCPGREDDVRRIRKMVKYMEAECQEDSHIFQVLSRNIACVTPAVRSLNAACSWVHFSDEVRENITDLLLPLWKKGIIFCPAAVERTMCASHVISKRCGSELKDVIANVFENTQDAYDECNEENFEELLPFKAYYETLILKEEILEDTASDEE